MDKLTRGRIAKDAVEGLCADPNVWATHGLPSEAKLAAIQAAIESAIGMALEASRPDSSGEAVREACAKVCSQMIEHPDFRDPGNPSYREGYEDGLNDCALEVRNLPLPTLPAAEGCEVDAKLTKPAWVGNGSFGIGVSERLVIDKAQRQYEYEMSPERVAKRAAARKKFIEEVNAAVVFAAPEPMSVWSKSQRPVSKSEEAGIDAALPAPPAAGEV